MGDVVNLNRVRKARARADEAAQAAVNRAKFGRTKAEREAEAAREALAASRLDGAKLEPGGSDGPGGPGGSS